MSDASADNKGNLRAEVTARLAQMSDDERHQLSIQACQRLTATDAFGHASTVMMYMPLASETDVTPVSLRCFQLQKTVCVPRVDWKRKDMVAVEVTSFDDDVMDVDEHGIRTPRDGRPVPPSMIDLIIVPGIAFDHAGRRLGRGGGFFDRFLPRLPRTTVTVGIAFEQQIVDEVPINDADVPVDLVVTNRRTMQSRSRARH